MIFQLPKEGTPEAEKTGFALGIVTAIATGLFLVFFQKANGVGTRLSVLFALFGVSALLNTALWVLLKKKRRPSETTVLAKSALFIACMTVLGNGAVLIALERLSAGVTGVLTQLQIFFVALLALLFLKEKASKWVIFGGVLATMGVSYYSWPSTEEALRFDSLGIFCGIVYALTMGATMVWTRGVIKKLDSLTLNVSRLWLSVLALAMWPGCLTELGALELRGWGYAIGAAIVGPFGARLMIMTSLRMIGATKTKLWSMLNPVFAFMIVYFWDGVAPSHKEWIGAIFIIAGVLIPRLNKLFRSPV